MLIKGMSHISVHIYPFKVKNEIWGVDCAIVDFSCASNETKLNNGRVVGP